MSFRIKLLLLVHFMAISTQQLVQAQETDIKYFGDMGIYTTIMDDQINNEMLIGDHAIFVASNLNERITFLSEVTIGQNGSDSYKITSERALIKFNIKNQMSAYVGKMHTPINYWNDVYHHGKLFFPTIDRPEFFQFFVPIHAIGIRLQNDNIGKLKFGYDFVLGDGISNSTSQYNIGKSFTGSIHIKPGIKSRISLGFYHDTINPNIIGAQSGLKNRFHNPELFNVDGKIKYSLLTASYAQFGKKVEILGEFIANRTSDKSEIESINGASYIYLGYKLDNDFTVFSQVDHIIISSMDLFTTPLELNKASLGLKYEFDYKINLKVQAGTCSIDYRIPKINNEQAYQLKVQLSYGF